MTQIDEPTIQPIKVKEKHMTNYNERLDEIFKTSPIDKEVPEDIWETIYATWTGLWTDGYGEWDEKQPSDIYPLDELLSTQAKDRLKQAFTSLIKELVAEAKRESHKSGYIQAIADFSGYYMDASIPALRIPIMPHIAMELTENYRYPQNLLKALEEV